MPWKRKEALRVLGMRDETDVGLERSAAIHVAFWGLREPGGMGGAKTSVRRRVWEGLERSSLARIWPMNPPAPVIRMCILKFELEFQFVSYDKKPL